jgi:hypothetical protein
MWPICTLNPFMIRFVCLVAGALGYAQSQPPLVARSTGSIPRVTLKLVMPQLVTQPMGGCVNHNIIYNAWQKYIYIKNRIYSCKNQNQRIAGCLRPINRPRWSIERPSADCRISPEHLSFNFYTKLDAIRMG